jgi:hypothetical protein
VTINGDRRIKRGGFVKLEATGEICYVDGVQNSISFNRHGVNRFTTLSLKRCMYEDYLRGYNENTRLTKSSNKLSEEEIRFRASLRASGSFIGSDISIIPQSGVTYYDIVNTDMIIEDLRQRFEDLGRDKVEGEDLDEEDFENVSKAVTQTGVNFGVNEDVFNFFLERRQMDDL